MATHLVCDGCESRIIPPPPELRTILCYVGITETHLDLCETCHDAAIGALKRVLPRAPLPDGTPGS